MQLKKDVILLLKLKMWVRPVKKNKKKKWFFHYEKKRCDSHCEKDRDKDWISGQSPTMESSSES